jgi:hypothetical protein
LSSTSIEKLQTDSRDIQYSLTRFGHIFFGIIISELNLSHGTELAHSPGLKGKIFSIGFTKEINEISGSSEYGGAAKSRGLGQCPSSAKTTFA